MLQLHKSLEIDCGMGYNREQMLTVVPLFQSFKKNLRLKPMPIWQVLESTN